MISEYPFDDQIFGDHTDQDFPGCFYVAIILRSLQKNKVRIFFSVCDAVCTDTVFGCGAWLLIGVGCIFCIAVSVQKNIGDSR